MDAHTSWETDWVEEYSCLFSASLSTWISFGLLTYLWVPQWFFLILLYVTTPVIPTWIHGSIYKSSRLLIVLLPLAALVKGTAWWKQQRPWSLLFRPYYKLGLFELYPTATRKEGDFERLLRIMRHQSSPDKKEPFFQRLNQVSTLFTNHTTQVRLGNFMRNLLAGEFWTSRGHNGAKNRQQRDAVSFEGIVSSVVFHLNLQVHFVIEM